MPDCYAKALELLARRPHFEQQLAAKLAARGFDGEEIADACGRLRELGYLDDERAAVELVTGALRRKGYGRRRVRRELERRGAPPAAVERALDALSPEEELELARQLAGRWRQRRAAGAAALARHLDRKGFSPPVIRRLLEEAGEEWGE